MSIAGAFAISVVLFAGLLVLDRFLMLQIRRLHVRRLYLAALDEACDTKDIGIIHARMKTPSLRSFRQ